MRLVVLITTTFQITSLPFRGVCTNLLEVDVGIVQKLCPGMGDTTRGTRSARLGGTMYVHAHSVESRILAILRLDISTSFISFTLCLINTTVKLRITNVLDHSDDWRTMVPGAIVPRRICLDRTGMDVLSSEA